MKDLDIIENYNSVLAFRNFLGNYNNLQTAYMAVAKGKAINFPLYLLTNYATSFCVKFSMKRRRRSICGQLKFYLEVNL